MTIADRDYGAWIDEELQHLLDQYIFEKDHYAETYTERSDLNKEIHSIKKEINRREKSE